MKRYLKIHTDDNVVIALEDLHEGDELIIDHQSIVIKSAVPFGHKIAITSIGVGEDIYKYGMSIGHATSNIEIGHHVHSHNMASNRK